MPLCMFLIRVRIPKGECESCLPIFVDLQELRTVNTIRRIAEFPLLDIVWDADSFERNGYFVRVWPGAIGVEGKRLKFGLHCA